MVIEQDGRPLAALVSTLDLEDLKKRDTERDERFKAMERLSEAFADVPVAELERQVELALQEARAELRAERESASRR